MHAFFFAHAGEVHQTVAESQTHYLQEWYVALPLYILGTALVAYVTFLLSKSKAVALLAVAAVSLVAGIALYNTSAVVSVVALAGGLAVTLFSVLTSLSKE